MTDFYSSLNPTTIPVQLDCRFSNGQTSPPTFWSNWWEEIQIILLTFFFSNVLSHRTMQADVCGVTFSLYSCWSLSSCALTTLSCSHNLLSLVCWRKRRRKKERKPLTLVYTWVWQCDMQHWTYISIHFLWHTCIGLFPVVFWTQLWRQTPLGRDTKSAHTRLDLEI